MGNGRKKRMTGSEMMTEELRAKLYRLRHDRFASSHAQKIHRMALDAFSAVVLRFDLEQRCLYVSQNLGQFFNVEPAQLLGRRISELGLPPEIQEAGERAYRQVLREGMPLETEVTFRSILRGEVTLAWLVIPERNPAGVISAALFISRDVTALRKVENKYDTLFTEMLDGFAQHEMIFDEEGAPEDYRFIAVNPAFERLTGLKASQVVGKTVKEIMPDTERHWLEAYGEVVKTGKPTEFENYAQALGKHYSISAFRNAPNQFVTIFEEVTARKEAEAALKREVERLEILHLVEEAMTGSMELHEVLETLVSQVVQRLGVVDAASILLLNPRTGTLDSAARYGFRTDALRFTRLRVGDGLAGSAALQESILYVEDLSELQNNPALAASIRDEAFFCYFGIPLLAKGQLLGVMEVFCREPYNPSPQWLTFLDTLARQAAMSIDNANLLRLTRQRLQEVNALYRISKGLIAVTEPQKLMDDVVELLKESFGYYYVQIFVVEPSSGDFVMRAGSGEIGAQMRAEGYRLRPGEGIVGLTADTGEPFFSNDVERVITFVRPPHLAETNAELAVPIQVGKSFLGLLDVHQKHPAYLTEIDVELVNAVAVQLAIALQKADLYTDLQDALHHEQMIRTQLVQSEKLTVAGRLLASVSHELNNPIQAIQNALFLLKNETNLSEQGRQDLEIVISEAERMSIMLQRLKVTYQPVSRQDFRPTPLQALVQEVFALLSTHLRHSRISYQVQAEPNLPPVLGVADQLKQVMLNLVMNAVDAMPDGGHITISARHLPETAQVMLRVSDTGIGIDEAILPKIFDSFVTNKNGGSGLGLAITSDILRKHNGRIHAQNNPTGGATFSIWLPTP